MTAAIAKLEARSRKTLGLIAIGFALIGGTIGAAMQQAFAATINCPHKYEGCSGSWSADQIFGWSNANEIGALPGRDDAWGYAAQDRLYGHDDADALFGGEGWDLVHGDWGNDSYYHASGGAGFGVYGNSEGDSLEGNQGLDIVQGDYGPDGMYGGDHDDLLFAEDGGGVDTVQGGGHVAGDGCWVDGSDSWAGCENVL